MSRNARSRGHKQRHGIAPGHGPMRLWVKPCDHCFGHIKRIAEGLTLPKFKSKALLSLEESQS